MRTRRLLSLFALVTAITAPACERLALRAPAFVGVADTKDLMRGVVQPAAAVYWNSVATTITERGTEETQPRTDAEWQAVWGAALTLAESGNLLMIPPRAQSDDSWTTMAGGMVAAGRRAAAAARDRKPEDVLAAGEQIYTACTRCHTKYLVDVTVTP